MRNTGLFDINCTTCAKKKKQINCNSHSAFPHEKKITVMWNWQYNLVLKLIYFCIWDQLIHQPLHRVLFTNTTVKWFEFSTAIVGPHGIVVFRAILHARLAEKNTFSQRQRCNNSNWWQHTFIAFFPFIRFCLTLQTNQPKNGHSWKNNLLGGGNYSCESCFSMLRNNEDAIQR